MSHRSERPRQGGPSSNRHPLRFSETKAYQPDRAAMVSESCRNPGNLLPEVALEIDRVIDPLNSANLAPNMPSKHSKEGRRQRAYQGKAAISGACTSAGPTGVMASAVDTSKICQPTSGDARATEAGSLEHSQSPGKPHISERTLFREASFHGVGDNSAPKAEPSSSRRPRRPRRRPQGWTPTPRRERVYLFCAVCSHKNHVRRLFCENCLAPKPDMRGGPRRDESQGDGRKRRYN